MPSSSISPQTLLASLKQRYAVKSFLSDPLAAETVEALKAAANLTPTSLGLQPIRLVHVRNKATREAMVPFSQPKVASASELFVIAAETRISGTSAGHYMRRISEVRGEPRETLSDFEEAVRSAITSRNPNERTEWAHRQAYLVLGNLLGACAILGVDACPMEGFKAAEIDRILGLSSRGLTTSVMLAAGVRDPKDVFAGFAKVRRPVDEFVITI
ncbi:MAG: nitroreductase/dihydropteridine reductase [Polyangiales bacterium]|jgi:nitroreductase/dihydropteridine reductase